MAGAARSAVDAAQVGLGECAPPWWKDGAKDFDRHLLKNTPYEKKRRPVRIDIAAYRELPSETRALIDEAAWAEFEQYAIVRETEWSTPDWTFLSFVDDALVAYFNLVDRVVRIDGEPVRVAGLNNMVTLPAHRGKGHASQLLRASQPKWFRELGFDAGLLLCADSLLPFYSRMGWRKVECPVAYAQPDGSRTWSENAMLLGGEGRLMARLQLDLCGLPW